MNIKTLNGSLGAYQAQMNPQMNSQTNRANKAEGEGRAQEGSRSAQAASASSRGDRINVSHDGVLRTTAMSTALSAGDVRQEKADAIKDSLSKGTYTIDNRKIAAKLVQEELDIFHK